MGIFRIEIKASGGHGCDRKAGPGDNLYARCARMDCPDCLAYDFVNLLRQKGFNVGEATFTHFAGAVTAEVVDDMMKNRRVRGKF